jgi:hypothetical protein
MDVVSDAFLLSSLERELAAGRGCAVSMNESYNEFR